MNERWTDRLTLLLTCVMASFGAVILLYWRSLWDQGFVTLRDWETYQRAAESLVSGEWAFYMEVLDYHVDDRPWLYPPYAVWFFAPLAWVPGGWAYGAMVLTQLASLGGAVWCLRKEAHPVTIGALLGCAGLFFNLMLGQIAATMLVLSVVAAVLWRDDRPVAAGMVWGLVALKPQLVLAAVFVALIANRRVFAGLAATGAVLFVMALPFGLGGWSDFVRVASGHGAYAMTEIATSHNMTVLGVLRATLPLSVALPLHKVLAVVGGVVLGVGAWRHRDDGLVVVSLATLYSVSLNVYVNTYDLILVFLPAAVWSARKRAVANGLFWTVACALVASWTWDQWVVTFRALLGAERGGLGSLTGTVALVWLVGWSLGPIKKTSDPV